jgi:signal transduction histidine kinase/ActR/RegA family two-component response regulator
VVVTRGKIEPHARREAREGFHWLAGAPASGLMSSDPRPGDKRREQLSAAETRLLFENAGTGTVATILIASLLAYAQWHVTRPLVVATWFLYTLLVSAARFMLARRYWRVSPSVAESRRWNAAFVVGAGLAAAGWGATAIVFPATRPINETFLVFVVGGVMLGAASLLAARPEAFLTFLLPTGLLTAMRLASEGDREHLMMGSLAALFTVATVATTWRFHLMIASSLKLGFDNHDLIEHLQTAKSHTEALNRDLELRVRDRTARLTEADQRKDEFLATLAHELRNPLAPIRFALENMKPGAPPAIAARSRDVIDRQVGQLVRLVDDLLDVSRITANKMVLRSEPHELGRLMATAVESILPLANAAEHTLTVDLPSTIVWVNGDGARLVQVFANILNNSVKFTPRGGRIGFTADVVANEAVVRIRDTGIGISSDVLPRMFDLFHQAEPILERSAGGLGIGLTLARRLVEMHEGRIDIRSAGPGEGTEVEIHLRVAAVPDTNSVSPELPAAAATRRLRVLVVEDNPDTADMLNVAVVHLGHTTRLAHDGATAIDIAIEFAPDLILLDIGLPAMSGYAVARTLRERAEFNHVHLAAVTGWGQEEDRRKAREAGFDSHFTKPLSPTALEQLLATIAQQGAIS